MSQTWPGSPRRPFTRHRRPAYWSNKQSRMSFRTSEVCWMWSAPCCRVGQSRFWAHPGKQVTKSFIVQTLQHEGQSPPNHHQALQTLASPPSFADPCITSFFHNDLSFIPSKCPFRCPLQASFLLRTPPKTLVCWKPLEDALQESSKQKCEVAWRSWCTPDSARKLQGNTYICDTDCLVQCANSGIPP